MILLQLFVCLGLVMDGDENCLGLQNEDRNKKYQNMRVSKL